ncbi:uncharacterized protein [Lepidochelys kempii]|uniref:uncharacterized protein n=1 Tax=Lepidochelys kempii TaxID=8472 RepID=UPI003C6FA09A
MIHALLLLLWILGGWGRMVGPHPRLRLSFQELKARHGLRTYGLERSCCYEALLLDEERGRLFVGGKNYLASLSLDNISKQDKKIYWPAPVEWREECNWAGKDINVCASARLSWGGGQAPPLNLEPPSWLCRGCQTACPSGVSSLAFALGTLEQLLKVPHCSNGALPQPPSSGLVCMVPSAESGQPSPALPHGSQVCWGSQTCGVWDLPPVQ